MKKSNIGTSIIEAVIVMMIIVIGVVGMFQIYTNSIKLSDSSEYRLQAIAMAREGIEAVTNIRDTNYILYSANTNNCWMTANYDSDCITAPDKYYDNGSYIVYKDSFDRWVLSSKATGYYSESTYRDNFKVKIDSNGFYTQDTATGTDFKPTFTREIKLTYLDSVPPQKVRVESIVRWADSSKTNGNFEVKFDTILTNWKK